MSKGWMVASAADAGAARALAEGFALELLDLASFPDTASAVAHIANADNVGVILSLSAAREARFVALLHALSQQRSNAQIILAEPEAREAFAFLPRDWPVLLLDEAMSRAGLAAQRRSDVAQAPHPAPSPQDAARDTPQANEEANVEAPMDEAPPDETPPDETLRGETLRGETLHDETLQDETLEDEAAIGSISEDAAPDAKEAAPEPEPRREEVMRGGFEDDREELDSDRVGESAEADVTDAAGGEGIEDPAPQRPDEVEQAPPAPAPASAPAPAPAAAMPPVAGSRPILSAPADATAFAPKKLRRATPELIKITVHQPKDYKAVAKAARQADANAEPAAQSMGLGDVALGAKIGIALEARGASVAGEMQRRTWAGQPIDFAYAVEAEDAAKQAVFVARVFIDDAQIGAIAFARPISGPKKKAADIGDGARMKRFKRVFLSYSSADRETVARIATAYEAAGVEHFWDRASLKSGEEWSPRLRKEIDHADLFHLCWSKAAAQSQWVEKEAEHALTRRKRSDGKAPSITVQMLDGPPWAPHPASLDSINFDDFVRAAIVGYARGED